VVLPTSVSVPATKKLLIFILLLKVRSILKEFFEENIEIKQDLEIFRKK